MRRAQLLFLSAVGEGGIGILLLAFPAAVLRLLFGVEAMDDKAAIIARLAGASLVALGIVCWTARRELKSAATNGVVVALLVYNVSAATLLAYASLGPGLAGVALWPAVVLHAALAAWCSASAVRPGDWDARSSR